MSTTPIQTIVNTGVDSGLSTIYPQDYQEIPPITNASIYITNTTEFITNIINKNVAGGEDEEVQFNIGDKLVGDAGLTYDMDTDTLTVSGNVIAGHLKTDHILYANGAPYDFSSLYGNTNVASYMPVYLPTYTGNLNANTITATIFSGNFYGDGTGLSVSGSNVSGEVANATYATTAGSTLTTGTVTTNAQPNITSVGTLTGLTVSSTISGSISGSALSVRQNSQPNITSVGTLTSLTVSGNITANYYIGNGSTLTHITGANVDGYVPNSTNANAATTAGTVTTSAQPNITSVGTLTGLTLSGNLTLQSNAQLTIANTASSTNTTTGALRVVGGISTQGNIHANNVHALGYVYAQGQMYAGLNSQATSFSNPVVVAKSTAADYVQIAVVNGTGTGSGDLVAYGDNGDDSQAWVDVGFTGSLYNDPNFTITGPNDGYLFVQGGTQGVEFPTGGNLVIATGDLGSTHDIIFATGGFATSNEKFRYVHTTNTLLPYSNVTVNLGDSIHYYNELFVGNVNSDGIVKTKVYTTSTIPNPVTAGMGARAFVSDADSTTFNAPYIGGSGNSMPVFSNGSAWYIG